jgi:hypothetical protein
MRQRAQPPGEMAPLRQVRGTDLRVSNRYATVMTFHRLLLRLIHDETTG